MVKSKILYISLCFLYLPIVAAGNNVASERKQREKKHSFIVDVKLHRDPEPISYKVLRDVHEKLEPLMSARGCNLLRELHSKAKDEAYIFGSIWNEKLRKIGFMDNNQFVHRDIARAICALLEVGPSNYMFLTAPEGCVKEWLT